MGGLLIIHSSQIRTTSPHQMTNIISHYVCITGMACIALPCPDLCLVLPVVPVQFLPLLFVLLPRMQWQQVLHPPISANSSNSECQHLRPKLKLRHSLVSSCTPFPLVTTMSCMHT